jgi:hypothetical protein
MTNDTARFGEFLIICIGLFVAFAVGLYAGSLGNGKMRDLLSDCQKENRVIQGYEEKK